MTVEERLDKLDREVRRVKRRSMVLVVAVCALAVGCAFVAVRARARSIDTAQAQAGAEQVVRAQKFELADEKGKLRAVLAVEKEGPRLDLADEKGETRAALIVNKHGPMLDLYDEDGTRAVLFVNVRGAHLMLFDEKGRRAMLTVAEARVIVDQDPLDENGRLWAVDEGGPGLRLYDEKGKLIWSAP